MQSEMVFTTIISKKDGRTLELTNLEDLFGHEILVFIFTYIFNNHII